MSAPLERPVVPDVNMIEPMSAGPISSAGGSASSGTSAKARTSTPGSDGGAAPTTIRVRSCGRRGSEAATVSSKRSSSTMTLACAVFARCSRNSPR